MKKLERFSDKKERSKYKNKIYTRKFFIEKTEHFLLKRTHNVQTVNNLKIMYIIQCTTVKKLKIMFQSVIMHKCNKMDNIYEYEILTKVVNFYVNSSHVA